MTENQLTQNYQTVQTAINDAAKKSNRLPTSIHLIAVSKTFPSEDIAKLHALGQKAFGENYVQEWQQKVFNLAHLDIEWHFIGPLQTNKTKPVSESAAWVHSIERLKIAERLNNQRPESMPPLNVCIQVNVSGEASKSGIAPSELMPLAEAIKTLPNLCLRGLMCVPKATGDTEQLIKQFAHMQALFSQLQTTRFAVDTLSMGMSHDMALAIEHGATHVRIGSAIFGQRDDSTQNI